MIAAVVPGASALSATNRKDVYRCDSCALSRFIQVLPLSEDTCIVPVSCLPSTVTCRLSRSSCFVYQTPLPVSCMTHPAGSWPSPALRTETFHDARPQWPSATPMVRHCSAEGICCSPVVLVSEILGRSGFQAIALLVK